MIIVTIFPKYFFSAQTYLLAVFYSSEYVKVIRSTRSILKVGHFTHLLKVHIQLEATIVLLVQVQV